VEARQTHELAQLCLAKTGGNPFFLNQFLMILAEPDMLRPNAASGSWQWDIERIREAHITDNVVELMVAKLRKLSEPTQRVLQGAACLGNAFDLKTLAMVCGLPQASTAQVLWPALAEEMIVPLDAHYKYAGQTFAGQESEDGGSQPTPHYRFLHDRVHQAASLLSSNVETAAMHLAIGRLWLKTYSKEQQAERLFDLVNHFNQGRSLIDNPKERQELTELNLQAGRRAKASAAYQPALKYLHIALELVSEEDWQQRHDLMLALHREAAEADYA
jgi:predicted ATPase